MGGIAAIARAAGHEVTGSDGAVYPPMSEQLESLGIDLIEGFEPDQLALKPDLIVVGNVMSRGMPIVETILNERFAYTSGPAWLAKHVLADRHVIAISGTHGKTTTASMTAWILEAAGRKPGFLIGGVPANFSTTARLGEGDVFVIEADEYDTAFFDKRAKFMHYDPRTLVINNLEFDHADIYKDMDAILWQFHQMLRILPGNGRVIANAEYPAIDQLLDMGCWTPVERYSSGQADADCWRIERTGAAMRMRSGEQQFTSGDLVLPGVHNLENAAAAVLAARHTGVETGAALQALERFRGVKRRLEHLGTFSGIRVYDDFAHHPTAIAKTLAALREGAQGRVLAVLEPRSNSMKLGAHREGLGPALRAADAAWVYQPPELGWSLAEALTDVANLSVHSDIGEIVAGVTREARRGDQIVIMSNGGFGGIHGQLCASLKGG
jgi:UDP-N-acetylmuramate: L-alanyl-gamma-D-glutamyl-meso-diaminopimelate ligase